MRYKLIGCEILYRELCYCAALAKNVIDLQFMPKGLHNVGEEKMTSRLQEEIDKVEVERYEAVLLAYGLCNNGIRGLRSSLPLVVPRAHDCITLLLGSKEKYLQYFHGNPGTYFKSTGWIERGDSEDGEIPDQLGLCRSYEDYARQYGEENARYLMEMLGDGRKNYSRLTFIGMSFGAFTDYERQVEEEAGECGWNYQKLEGSLNLLMRLVNGQWDEEDFLVIPPGATISPSHDESIIRRDPG